MEIIPCIAILYNSTIFQELAFQKSWSYFIFELMVYFHGEQLMSCWDFSKVLVTLFIVKSPEGRLPILSAYYFICNNTCNITGNNICCYFKRVTNLAIANLS